MKNIVILISGRGSNMEAILRAASAEKWPAQILAVISNKAQAAGLETAKAAGIAARVVEHLDRFACGDCCVGEQRDGREHDAQPDRQHHAGVVADDGADDEAGDATDEHRDTHAGDPAAGHLSAPAACT